MSVDGQERKGLKRGQEEALNVAGGELWERMKVGDMETECTAEVIKVGRG